MRLIGLDAGSVSVKTVTLDDEGRKLGGRYEKHLGHPLSAALELLKAEASLAEPGEPVHIAVTGSAGRLIAKALRVEPTNEIVAQSYATQKLHPRIKTIIEMGGEDSKLIILGESGVEDFAMNSVCAAGTGSFLDQQAERLRLGIEDFSALALQAERPPRIAGRCSVFAKSDMIHLQQIATPVENIVAGLCFAVARNFKGTILKGRDIKQPVSFQGGVAANVGMVRAFKEVLGIEELFVPPHHALMGAWGAALKALDDKALNKLKTGLLEDYIHIERTATDGHAPLISRDDRFTERHVRGPDQVHAPAEKVEAYMGIDIGSISTNLAVIDTQGRLLGKRYLMTSGRPIEAVKTGLRELSAELAHLVDIRGAGTTGSGRYMIADFTGADIVKNEITAQATAAAYIDKEVDTIFEIGGQDSKFISIRDGVVVDFEMNKACAAGTGSFLEEQAEKLNVSVKDEFARCAFASGCPTKLGERCTVFMENSLMSSLQRGGERDDLLSGLAYSIVQNYINRVVAGKHIGEKIFFQGGVAFNKSVVAAFEKYLGLTVTVPPHHDVTGAIGMALIAKRHMEETGLVSTFKGFGLAETGYELSSFQCNSCSNVCEINRVKIEGDGGGLLFYGGRCEKYDLNKKKSTVEDLFEFRNKMLRKTLGPEDGGAEDGGKDKAGTDEETKKPDTRPVIGMPNIFYFHDRLPFWAALMKSLGYRVEPPARTDRKIIALGLEGVLSDACFPIKVAHGHIRYLKEKGIKKMLIPSFVNTNTDTDEFDAGLACPHTQTIPYVSRVAIDGIEIVAPIVDVSRGSRHLVKELKKTLGVSGFAARRALEAAEKAQAGFTASIKAKGREFLKNLDRRAIVVVGRAYNSYDKGVNLGLPEKLAGLGVPSIPMDFLPIEDIKIKDDWPNMYWRSGQNILKAARFIRDHPHLYPIFIGNFSCGPDSFILKLFRQELRGKPFLHIEIDEHSADAGALTRCEAFLDSIENQRPALKDGQEADAGQKPAPQAPAFGGPQKKRTVFIPSMSDHTYAIKAAFERSGVPSEVLPPSDRKTIDIGMNYVSGKECYPFLVTTGDMVKQVMSPGFKSSETAFFMPSGSGPCRFGQYNVFHRQVLDSLDLRDVPIFAPNQDANFYRELGDIGKDFTLNAWNGIVAIELLTKCLHETRPYEKEKGASDSLYQEYLEKTCLSLSGRNGQPEDVIKSMRRAFQAVPRTGEQRPLIGIVGEIFVRSSRFSNEDLVRKCEELGGEVQLASVEEWVYYINLMGIRKSLIKRDVSAIIENLLKRFFQKRTEHRYGKLMEGFLKNLHEPTTTEVLKKAAPYVHDSFEGETVLSIGKAVDMMANGASGVINAMPFGCMPGTIVTALMRAVSRDYGVPSISIPYDGTESPTTEIQLEAFVDQAKSLKNRR